MKINEDIVPTTIKELVDMIVAGLAPDEIEHIKTDTHASVHFGAGMGIRNDFSLWEWDTPIKNDAIKNYRIAHADDISGLVFEWVWAIVRNDPFDPEPTIQRFEEHWRGYGYLDAVEAGTPFERLSEERQRAFAP